MGAGAGWCLSPCVSSGKGAQLQIRGRWSAGPGDDQARFLADLRALRDTAAIEYDELAARAHYPSDILKEAENGPLLPGLPILTAYVRACDGDVPDWEERWRRLTSELPEDPDLPVRPAGASPAAVAGARAGVGIAPPEVYDPERIKAALRGGHARSGQGGSGQGDGSGSGDGNGSREAGARSKAPGGWSTTPGWGASSDETITIANGNHAATSWSSEPFDAEVEPDPAGNAEQFRWLPDEESAFPEGGTGLATTGPADTWPAETGPADTGIADTWPADTEPAGTGLADTGLADTGLADTGLADTGLADTGLADTGPAGTALAGAGAERTVTDWTPRWDEAAKPTDGTDFWSTSVATPAADLQRPATASRQVDDQTYAPTSWSAADPAAATSALRPAQWAPSAAAPARSDPAAEPAPSAGAATATQPRTSAGSARSTASTRSPAAQAATHEAATHQKDRFFPVRLLMIIVIAALIGSVLVLLLK
jgi:hypothetical protein